ncbi:unnamed protein product [Staurois parvus]|uniref:Uncharacterized protein n=1 Tax=Staurois parvus TaxID=386267 RepID=A0ABN9E3B8_9NEOB|nr:unnamed protein product [Staurois parvus]
MPSTITEAGRTAPPHGSRNSLMVIPVLSAVSGHLLYCVRSLWSFSCTVSAVSGHLLYCVRADSEASAGRRRKDKLHGSPQSLVISFSVCSLWSSPAVSSAVSGHHLYCVCSLWSSPVLCLQSLVISCTVSAVSGHLLYCVRSLWSSPVLCPQSLVISW